MRSAVDQNIKTLTDNEPDKNINSNGVISKMAQSGAAFSMLTSLCWPVPQCNVIQCSTFCALTPLQTVHCFQDIIFYFYRTCYFSIM